MSASQCPSGILVSATREAPVAHVINLAPHPIFGHWLVLGVSFFRVVVPHCHRVLWVWVFLALFLQHTPVH
eukprot:12910882-Prorocentrum_lima.AAC.1